MSFDHKYGLWPILDSVLDFGDYSQYSVRDYIDAIDENVKAWRNSEHGLYFLSRDAQHSGEVASVAHHLVMKSMIHFNDIGEFIISGDFDGVKFGDNGYKTVYCDYRLVFTGVKNFELLKKEFSVKDLTLLKETSKSLSTVGVGKDGVQLSQCYQVGDKICFIFGVKLKDAKKDKQSVCFYEISFEYSGVEKDVKLSPVQEYHYPTSSFKVLAQKVDYTKNSPKFKKRKLKKRTPKRVDLKSALNDDVLFQMFGFSLNSSSADSADVNVKVTSGFDDM